MGRIFAATFLSSRSILFELIMFCKILNFDLFTPRARGWEGVPGQNICYHVAASVIPFNLICNMTVF